jgi:hypothetical protein
MRFSPALLDLDILPSTLFTDSLSLRSYLNVSDKVSHPYETRRNNFNFVYFTLYVSTYQTGKQKILKGRVAGIFCIYSVLNFLVNGNVACYRSSQNF